MSKKRAACQGRPNLNRNTDEIRKPSENHQAKIRAELIVNRRTTGISIERDPVYPAMWRIRRNGGPPSDMVNISRATDAAITWARPRSLGGEEAASWRWDLRESPREAPPMRQNAGAVGRQPSRDARLYEGAA
jgi:hypothetical protein